MLLLPPLPGGECAFAVNRAQSPAVCCVLISSEDADGRFRSLSAEDLEIPAMAGLPAAVPQGTWRLFLCGQDLTPLAPALSSVR